MTNIITIEKDSLQSKFSHYDAKNPFIYLFTLSNDHNQLLIVMKQRCDPSKVDDRWLLYDVVVKFSTQKKIGIKTPKLHYAIH